MSENNRVRRREGGESSNGGDDRPKKSKKVMGASSQTYEERRELRGEQRTLKSKIIEQQSDIGDLDKDTCRELTMENKKLFRKTRYPREAVNDADNMKLIARAAAEQVKKVNSGSVGVDGDAVLETIKKYFSKAKGEEDEGAATFNWGKWGGNVSMVFLAVPERVGFMMGPLDKPEKTRKAPQKREKHVDDAEEVVPEMQMEGRKARQNRDQTQMRIAEMREHEKHTLNKGSKKDMFETLINPKSFTQTVENLFDFSFFVKSGEAHIMINEESKLPQVVFDSNVPDGAQGGDEGNKPVDMKQWLMSFTPADFRELRDVYGMKESNFKHRDEGPKSDYYDPLVHGNRESNRQ